MESCEEINNGALDARFGDLSGIGDRAGDRGNVSFGVVQGLALEERVVVVVSPNLAHQEQGLAEVLLALCSDSGERNQIYCNFRSRVESSL